MSDGKPRLARLTAILTLLQSKRLVTAREIARKHNVSIRTVYRDMRTLEQSGIPIYTEEGKGYSIMEGYKLPPVMFTEEEAHALITAEHLISKNKDKSLTDHYGSAITKIKAVLRNTQLSKADLLSDRMEVRANKDFRKTSTHLITVQSAITSFQILKIDYQTESGDYSSRDIEPFALFHTQQNWVLIAYCRLRKDFRAFRLDRIHRLVYKNQSFEPHQMTLQDYLDEVRKKWATTPDTPLTPGQNSFALNQKTDTMQTVHLDSFQVIGISVRTQNSHGQAAQDIPKLWERFLQEGIMQKIPNRISDQIYSIYTNYESDYNGAYDTIVACPVSSLEDIPDGMIGQAFDASPYFKKTVRGDIKNGLIYNAWTEIWKMDINRAYTADFEIYGEKSMNLADAEVDIYVAVNT